MRQNIIYLLLLASFTFTTTSCDKFLDRDPLGQIGQDEYFNSETNANSALMGMYRSMMNSYSYGQSTIIVPEFSARHVRHAAEYPEYENFATHQVQTINPWTANMWKALYTTINAANQIIDEVPKMTASMITDQKKNIFIGEAKFIRAFNYFFLVRAFGRIPLKVTYTQENSELDTKQSEKEEVYAQIISDLNDAINLLPAENTYTGDANRGRASHWAAKALLAKVYLYQAAFTNDYKNAASLSEEVLSSGKYNLPTAYPSIWTTQNSSEAIFEIQFDDQATNPLAAVSNDNATVLFLAKDSTLLDLYREGDQRKTFTVKKGSKNNYFMGKFPNFSPASQNVTAIRLAEIYLIHAEAKARIDNGVTQAAYNALKKVQERAGYTTPINDYNSLEVFIKAVQEEKERELLFEGETWFDYCRTKLALAKYSSLKDEKYFLYPIPAAEIGLGNNLTQNPGY
ncbi:RagB/SusD family nutrient uptake outer membrane protein [Sphingobacterium yanglingense]|uniref:RagB/SusD domain-containing protein n=1 Tax=Sphingobacterium yanglingense TaxID=1437280 RepID=A0A4R6WGR5_9SPHI|nr:RagB/SusD family nutrient uptake outer membrane protein [Sphingobacterium yanglingense]TDQ76960.1 RagB/SusD domain-containing protein [Sphingobacterium yanglingense]